MGIKDKWMNAANDGQVCAHQKLLRDCPEIMRSLNRADGIMVFAVSVGLAATGIWQVAGHQKDLPEHKAKTMQAIGPVASKQPLPPHVSVPVPHG